MAEVRETGVRVAALVIGGGVVGCAVLRELAMRGVDSVLLEAGPDIGLGSSKANSAILHSGYDAKPGTVEARLLRRSRDLWPLLLEELSVPFLPVGALMVVRTAEERARLDDEIVPVAAEHGVETEVIEGGALCDLAPYLAPDALAALSIPAEGIVDPFWLTRAFAEAAIAGGARIRTSAPVTAIDVDERRVVVTTEGGDRYEAEQAFDCGGLFADDVAALAGDTSFSIRPRKGQFLVSETTFGVDRIVLPVPGPMGKGMLVTPIVFGGVLLGPTAEDIDDKTDRSADRATRERIIESCASLVPDARQMTPIRQFAGLRAASGTGDYILRPSTAGDRLHIVAGIRSTGISASAAIAEAVVDEVAQRRGWEGSRGRRVSPPEPEWAAVAGEVVCVCRSVAEAEVEVALHRPSPAATVDGLKRRCGVAFGDCQGNLCAMPLVERLATARGVEPWAIEKDLRGSWIVAGPTTITDHAGGWSPPSAADPEGPVDVAIVGGGAAGIGAALTAVEAGQSVVVIDRGARPGGALRTFVEGHLTPDEGEVIERIVTAVDRGDVRWLASTTAIGLHSMSTGWAVEFQHEQGSGEIAASQVVLATGGYVTPREHRAIDGPRPSGVLTADAAFAALERGWLPALRPVVVGDGRLADALVDRLAKAGATITRDGGAAIDALAGIARVERVRLDGSWVDADALIFADRFSPATFLLRGLGLVDEAPGVPAPTAADGSLAPGMWAAGSCVTGDVDHVSSLEDGRRVGRAAASAFGATVL